MSTPLTILRKYGLLGRSGPVESSIERLSLSEIVDITEEIDEAVRAKHKPVINPLFSHSASLGLSGSSWECAYIGCRIKRITQLARFALMYSDRVFIDNPLSQYKELDSKDYLSLVKQDLLDDLKVLYVVAPLIDKGFISLFSPHTDVCFSCQAKEFLGEKAGRQFSRSYAELKQQFLDQMSVECRMRYGEYEFICDGPSPYFDHGYTKSSIFPLPAIARRPMILKRVQKGSKVQLSRTLIKDTEFHVDFAREIACNAIYGLATSYYLNTTFLTEHDLHVSFLNSLHEGPIITRKNALAAKHVSSIVPFLEDVSLRNIMKLRKREQDAFLLYRQSLNQAIECFRDAGDTFTEKDARALYGDLIAPQLAKLDQKVKRAKRDLATKPLRSVTGLVGVISFGLLTGLVSPDISALVQALGLVKFGSDLIKDFMALGDKEKAIENDHFYFLWKVKRKAK